jgi:archaeoflavoprotein AfpA
MKKDKLKVAWGITGSGDKIKETIEIMSNLKEKYGGKVEIEVFLSKAAEQVVKYYKIYDRLHTNFSSVWVEENANKPFLVGRIQLGEFRFILIVPATSNTVAKIAHGISDTLVTNSVIQALKTSVPVYIMPCDYYEGETTTTLPSGRSLKLRVRKEDANNVRVLESMKGLKPFQKPEEIIDIFKAELGPVN